MYKNSFTNETKPIKVMKFLENLITNQATTEFYTYKNLRNAATDATRRTKRDFFINGA